jgi:cyclic pyranopterin phosphate synthase
MSPMEKGLLLDGHGRRITYARISLTDRCNLRCVYCMPETPRFLPLPHLMTREEIRRAAALLAHVGVAKVRLTGGEPTVRPDLVDIVSDMKTIGFPGGIALSTNGVLFTPMAERLLHAGLSRVNVSLDAVEAEHFRKMARRGHPGPVLSAVERALSLPYESVKLNTVVMRGLNDDQVLPLAELTFDKPLGVRFIEYMPFGDNGWTREDWIGREELLERLVAAGYVLNAIEKGPVSGPADEFLVRSGRGEHRGTVGFIAPVSDRFCDACNRIRLTQDGFLKGCLFGHADVDLLTPMRAGASDGDLLSLVERAAAVKEERHPMSAGMSGSTPLRLARNMSQVGG